MNDHLDSLLARAARTPDPSAVRVRADVFVLALPTRPPEQHSQADPDPHRPTRTRRLSETRRAASAAEPDERRARPPDHRQQAANTRPAEPSADDTPTSVRAPTRRAEVPATRSDPGAPPQDIAVTQAQAAGSTGQRDTAAAVTPRPEVPQEAQPVAVTARPVAAPAADQPPPLPQLATRERAAELMPVLRPPDSVPARDAERVEPQLAPIEIVIDRVDVRLVAPRPVPTRRPAAPPPGLSLADYLDRRSRS
jgi:hypothetical protein